MKSQLSGRSAIHATANMPSTSATAARELLKSAEDTLQSPSPRPRSERTGRDRCLHHPDRDGRLEATVGPPGAAGLTLESPPAGAARGAHRPPSDAADPHQSLRAGGAPLGLLARHPSDAARVLHGDLVQIEVYLRGHPHSSMAGQASLPMCLARALLELHGASLFEVEDPHLTVARRNRAAVRCANGLLPHAQRPSAACCSAK